MAYAVTSVQDIAKQLVARFDAPLDELEDRRLIIWHDLDGSFEDEFDRISSSGLGDRQEARPVVFAKIDEGSQFELKRRIYREESESDFLIYSRSKKIYRRADWRETGLRTLSL